MSEQDAMARLVAANPVPRPVTAGSSQALFCLRTVLAQPPAQPPRRRRARRFLLAAAALALIAGGGVAVLHQLRPDPVAPLPGVSIAAPPAIFTAAAARAREAGEAGQFRHVSGTTGRVVHVGAAGGYDVIRVDSVQGMQPADGRPGEGWLTIGEEGSSVRPMTAADALAYRRDGSPGAADLPQSKNLAPNLADDPEFAGDVGELPAAADQGWLFREGTRLLDTFSSSLTGADRAKIFQILAGLTAVRTLETSTDPLGRPAVGLAYTGETPRYGLIDWQIYLLAGSDQIGFTQAVVRRPGPANATLAPGAVQYSTAVTRVVHSDTP